MRDIYNYPPKSWTYKSNIPKMKKQELTREEFIRYCREQSKLKIQRERLQESKYPYIALSIIGLILSCTLILSFIGIPVFIVGLIKISSLNKRIGEIDTKLNRTTLNNFLK